MKRIIYGTSVVLVLVAVALAFWASQRIWSYSQLEPACKEKTYAVLVADGFTPIEWTPTMKSTLGGELLNQYGRWRVGQQHVDVLCSAKKGRAVEKMGWEISEPQ